MNRRIWILARKEVKGYFDSPTAYVLLAVWTALSAFFFFRAAYLIGEVSARPLFELLPWFLLFFVPAATMRSMAAEKKEGTLEILLSHPISEGEVVAGKLVSNVLFLLVALALTLTMPLGLALGGRLDIGMLVGQYLGAVFLIIGMAAVGLFASSTSRNQTTAFIISLTISFVLLAAGLDFILLAVPSLLTDAVRQLGALTHFESMARGVISLADVAYFSSLTAIFLTLSYFFLRRDRESRQSARFRSLRTGTALIIVASAISALIGTNIGWRLDLTEDHAYSLSPASVKIVRSLQDPVTITLYASRELPPEVGIALRDSRDLIIDYQAAGRGRVKAVVKRSGNKSEDMEKVAAAGVQSVQFNVVRQDEYQVKQGHLGLTVKYQDKQETIPFLNQTDDLEYQLSSLIRKVSTEKRNKVGFVLGDKANANANPMNMGAPPDSGYTGWQSELSKQYDVEPLNLTDKTPVPKDMDVVVIAGFTGDVGTDTIPAISRYLDGGGSVLALVDAVNVDQATLAVEPIENDLTRFVAMRGLKVESKLAFDMQANQPVQLGEGASQYLLPYPFWMKAGAGSNSAIVRDIGAVTIPWGQPIALGKGTKGAEPLLVTSRFAGVQEKDFNITPQSNMQVKQRDLRSRVLAASLKVDGGGRLIVVGNSQFVSDKFLGGGGSENLVFGLNAVDWLAQDLALAGIRAKVTESRVLVFSSDGLRDFVRYFNLIGMPILVALFGLIRLTRRRRLTSRKYAA